MYLVFAGISNCPQIVGQGNQSTTYLLRRRSAQIRSGHPYCSLAQKHSCTWLLIMQVTGGFGVQDAVALCDEEGVEFARALVNHSAADVRKASSR